MDAIRKYSSRRGGVSRSRCRIGENLSVVLNTQTACHGGDIWLLDVATGLEFIRKGSIVYGDLQGVQELIPFRYVLAEF